jgi:hypothetical protein
MNLNEEIKKIRQIINSSILIKESSKVKILTDKIGFTENFAKDLYHICGTFSVIMGNKIIDWATIALKKPDSSTPEKLTVVKYLNDVGLTRPWKEKLQEIIDFVRVGLNGNFSSLKNDSFDEMVKKAKKWHESLGGGTAKINYVETHPILLDFRDKNGLGFYWANLETNDSREECERMGHCGRTASGNIIYSLREVIKIPGSKYSINKSHLSASISKGGTLFQLKGPTNSKPKDVYQKFITPLFYALNDTEDENDFLIQDFGTEYASDRDFKLQDLPNDTLINLYKNRPELFESRRLQRLLNKLGVIDTPKINFNIKIELDPSKIDDYVTGGWIVSRPRKNKEGKTVGRTVDIFETILSGDIWDIYDGYNDNNRWSDILDYYIDNNNEKLIWEKVKILSEKNDIEITNDMNLEDSIKLVDDNWDIRNVLTSSSSDAEMDSYYNHLYKTLKDALSEYGEITKMDDTGVDIEVNVEPFLNAIGDNELEDDVLERCNDDISCVFAELVYDGTIDKPKFDIDDRWTPDIDDNYFNSMVKDRLSEF